jgi:hypothetical protein
MPLPQVQNRAVDHQALCAKQANRPVNKVFRVAALWVN